MLQHKGEKGNKMKAMEVEAEVETKKRTSRDELQKRPGDIRKQINPQGEVHV